MKDSPSAAPEVPSYDFVVIGGGSAGYAAARTAAGLGLKTALVEGGREIGGLCILHGCMPSKTLIESSNRFVTLRRAREFGLRAEDIRAVGPEMLARKQRLVGEFADYRRQQLKEGEFDFIRGLARFTGEHRLAITPVEEAGVEFTAPPPEIEARTFLIATGSKVAEVPVPGLKEAGYLTSDDVLALADFPKSAVILGAGAIGLEAAHYLAGLGSEVSVVQRGGYVLREADTDVAGALEQALTRQGVSFRCGAHLLRVEANPGGEKRVWFECGGGTHSVAAQEIIFALGRQPCTDRLDVGRAGVELTKKGGVRTGPDQRSSRRHIFAAGDVCGPYEIVHIAVQQAELAARNAARHLGRLAGPPEEVDLRLKLFVLFTEPQVAMVGMGEREARETGRDCVAATHPFADHGKSIVMGETDGFVKLVADRATGEIVGGAVVGPEGAELIHEITVAMAFRATAAQLAAVPHYHPTLSEIWTYPAEELAGLPGNAIPASEENERKR